MAGVVKAAISRKSLRPATGVRMRVLLSVTGLRGVLPLAFGALVVALSLAACGGGGGGGGAAPVVPPPDDDPQDQPAPDIFRFTETGDTIGLPKVRVTLGPGATSAEWTTPGLAAADYDGDGDVDLYVVGGERQPSSLYQNQGDGTFVDVAPDVGVALVHKGSGPTFADIDGDGDLDLFVGAAAGDPYFVLRNDNGSYVDVTVDSGIVITKPHTLSATFSDYDRDGDLDLFLSHWSSFSSDDTETLWRNKGDGTFESYSVESGVSAALRARHQPFPPGANLVDHSFTPNLSDIDGDGDPDLLMSGDFGSSEVMINNGDGTFSRASDGAVITDEFGMGGAVGDYDNDGDMDWFVSSIFGEDEAGGVQGTGNRLYRNDGQGVFENVTDAAGIADGAWGWGSCFADFDNDGFLDIFHVNGWFDPVFGDDQIAFFHNNGDGTFTERAFELGLRDNGQGRGVACFDANRDGDIDIAFTNNGEDHLFFYRNDLDNGNHYLGVSLVGQAGNPFGIGSRITVSAGAETYVREIVAGNNFVSQNPLEAHFGLGAATTVNIEVRWPDGGLTNLSGVSADTMVEIVQPVSDLRLTVSGGQGSGNYSAGDEVPIEALAPAPDYHFSHWSSQSGAAFADARAASTTFTMPGGSVVVSANYVPGVAPGAQVSVARRWSEVLLQAIRNDFARPTVHARNLFHVSAAMYDAWSAYDDVAVPWLLGRERVGVLCERLLAATPADVEAQRQAAVSYAAYRLIAHRFAASPGGVRIRRDAEALMGSLGYSIANVALDYSDGGGDGLGNYLADCYIRLGFADGANEENDYDNLAYTPVNPPLQPELPGNPDIADRNRWQPLLLLQFIDQSGNPVSGEPEFLSPEWGSVLPFALQENDLVVYNRDGYDYQVYHDPGMPPTFDGTLADSYKWNFSLVALWSSHLDPADGVMVDISPASVGNVQSYPAGFEDYPTFYDAIEGGDASPGHAVNPVTGAPYAPQLVPRGDYGRVLAEFWADGPDSETPPGHWFVISNEVNDHELLSRRLGGAGPELSRLEWDTKTYFVLGGAMHDSAISAWGIKGWYDYIRPVSALRAMAALGQSSDPLLPSYHIDGIGLEPGFIELIGEADPLAGDSDEFVGEIKLRAWRGPDYVVNPTTDVAGVGWIRAASWWPYQRPSFVTPPFAGYVSGHSTYSRAAAEVLTALTGDAFFPGGKSGFEIEANNFLVFENGPSVSMTLEWATYRDASDQCSLSRIWGGIHPPADDIPGRLIGREIGIDAFAEALRYFDGTADQ